MFKKVLAVALIILVTFSISGCNTQEDIYKSGEDGKEYKLVEEVTIPMTYVRTLNPVASKDKDTFFISKLVYDSLFTMDENMTPVANLAESYTFNGDNSVTVNLIDTTWHDGQKLGAKDISFSIKAHKMKGEESQYASLVSGIEWSEIISSSQIKIYFSNKKNMNLAMLSFPIIPAHKFSTVGKAGEEDGDFIPVGTGQYKCKSYNGEREMILVPNEDYHETPATNTLKFSILPAKADTYNLLESGTISLLSMFNDDRQTKFQSDKIEFQDYPSNHFEFIGFNLNRTPFDQKSIRKAIAYAVDKDRIIEECYLNSGMKNNSIYYPNYLGAEEESEEKSYEYSLNKSEEYLEKAGFKDEDSVGYLQNKDGEILKVNILVNRDNEARVLYSEIIKESLEDLKIQVTITSLSKELYEGALRAGNFDIYIGGYEFDAQMDLRPLLGEGEYNYTGYSNGKVKDLLDELQSGKTVEESKKLYGEINNTVTDELPYFCVLFKANGVAKASNLHGDLKPTFDNVYRGMENLKSKYEIEEE